MRHLVISIGILLMLNGCSSGIEVVKPGSKIENNPKEAIGIIKISPKDSQKSVTDITLTLLAINDKGLYQKPLSFANGEQRQAINADKESYFIFSFKVYPENKHFRYAITQIRENNKVLNNFSYPYSTTCGGQSIAFGQERSGIYYFGNLSYQEKVSSIGEVKFSYDKTIELTKVKKFVATNFPSINVDTIKTAELEEHWNHSQCQPARTVIYIG